MSQIESAKRPVFLYRRRRPSNSAPRHRKTARELVEATGFFPITSKRDGPWHAISSRRPKWAGMLGNATGLYQAKPWRCPRLRICMINVRRVFDDRITRVVDMFSPSRRKRTSTSTPVPSITRIKSVVRHSYRGDCGPMCWKIC